MAGACLRSGGRRFRRSSRAGRGAGSPPFGGVIEQKLTNRVKVHRSGERQEVLPRRGRGWKNWRSPVASRVDASEDGAHRWAKAMAPSAMRPPDRGATQRGLAGFPAGSREFLPLMMGPAGRRTHSPSHGCGCRLAIFQGLFHYAFPLIARDMKATNSVLDDAHSHAAVDNQVLARNKVILNQL